MLWAQSCTVLTIKIPSTMRLHKIHLNSSSASVCSATNLLLLSGNTETDTTIRVFFFQQIIFLQIYMKISYRQKLKTKRRSICELVFVQNLRNLRSLKIDHELKIWMSVLKLRLQEQNHLRERSRSVGKNKQLPETG